MYKLLIISDLFLVNNTNPEKINLDLGTIHIFDPCLQYNNGLEVIKPNMYQAKDVDIYTICTKEQFADFLKTLEKLSLILGECPILDGLKNTNNFSGEFVIDCFTFLLTNMDIIFRPSYMGEFTTNEAESQNFQLIYLKLLEVFRKAGANGFIQFNTYKNLDK